jgi:hypothetical protein
MTRSLSDWRRFVCGAIIVALGGLTALSATAANHIADIAWDARGGFAHTATVQPGKFIEVCGKLEAGGRVRWDFDATGPVDFNIHYHVGKEAVFPARQTQVSSGRDTLNVAVAQDYCWMWTNKGAGAASLRFTLARR